MIVDRSVSLKTSHGATSCNLAATTAALLGVGTLLNACDEDNGGPGTPTPTPSPTPARTFAQPLPQQPAITDQDVLNFALDLGFLSASFYSFAVTGAGIPSSILGSLAAPGSVYGGAKVTFTDTALQSHAQEIMQRELQHLQPAAHAAGYRRRCRCRRSI